MLVVVFTVYSINSLEAKLHYGIQLELLSEIQVACEHFLVVVVHRRPKDHAQHEY